MVGFWDTAISSEQVLVAKVEAHAARRVYARHRHVPFGFPGVPRRNDRVSMRVGFWRARGVVFGARTDEMVEQLRHQYRGITSALVSELMLLLLTFAIVLMVTVVSCAGAPTTTLPVPTATLTKINTVGVPPIAPALSPQPTIEPQPILVISGYVSSGGDSTPKGLFDVPRKFIYKIQADDGSVVDVTYTAYPPSLVGDRGKRIKLNFHAGTILIGDYLRARGRFDKNTSTLVVAEDGDYIETYAKKPQ